MRNRFILFKLFLILTPCLSSEISFAQKRDNTLQADTSARQDTATKYLQLLYNKTARHLTAASTDAVYTKDLVKSQVTNVYNAVTGRLSGVLTNQSSGMPSADGLSGVSLSLRGRNPLVLVDGIPRSLLSISLEDIESVTVLKDALATAMLGVRGANGALVITTRKGAPGKQVISFTAQTAIQKPLDMPQPLGAYDYARLRNEAVDNELKVNPNFNGTALRYSDADILAYQNETDPIGHPNVNWKDQVLRKSSKFNRYNLNATGGSKYAQYFIALEHLSQQGLLKTNDANPYNTNNDIKSYMARANVDINIKPNLTAGIYVMGRLINGNTPGVSTSTVAADNTASSIFSNIWATPNNAYPVFNSDGSLGGVSQFTNNIWAQATASGYRLSYTRDLLSDFYLKRTLNEITPGLFIKARASYSANVLEDINRSKPFVVYQQQTATNGDITYKSYNTLADQANLNSIRNQGRGDYLELSLGYNRVFNSTHGFDILLLANRDNTASGPDLPYTITGGSGKFSYNFKEKYVAEFAFGLNGSNRYPDHGNTKYGFFPAGGLAWNIDKEDFLSGSSAISSLKLFTSYGITGWDNPGYFSYIKRWNSGSNAYFGTSAGAFGSLAEQINNPDITWEKAKKFNLGLQGSVLNHALGFSIEYYNNKYYDLLMQRGKTIAFFGNSYPNQNIGKNRYSGFAFQLSLNKNVGKNFNYFVSADASIQNSKVLFMDEVNQPYSWMTRTGQMVGQAFGYIATGLFQSQSEIDNGGKNNAAAATFIGYTPQPGDIRYKDLNEDGIINQLDVAPIGSTKPTLIGGVNLGFRFKSFDFSALLQGVANRFVDLRGNAYFEFQNNGSGQAYENHLNRWTPQTAATATYPRLSIGNNVNNQQPFSTYWYKNGDYVRLKNLEIGYTLPAVALKVIKLNSLRLFVNGLNLATFTGLDGVDPEVNRGAYPIQKLYNFGVNVKL